MDRESEEDVAFINQKCVEAKTTSHGEFCLRSDNVLVFKPFSGSKAPSIMQLEEDFETMKSLIQNTPIPLLSFVRATAALDPASKQFVQNKLPEIATAYAMVADSPLARFNISVFLYIYRPSIPIKVFRSTDSALSWLKNNSK